jgi:hypothetical protein
MYANASNITLSYTHVSLYVISRVHPPGPFHVVLGIKQNKTKLKKRGHMPEIATQNKHVTKGGGNKCGKVGHYKCKGKWGGGPKGGGGFGLGEGMVVGHGGLMCMGIDVHA